MTQPHLGGFLEREPQRPQGGQPMNPNCWESTRGALPPCVCFRHKMLKFWDHGMPPQKWVSPSLLLLCPQQMQRECPFPVGCPRHAAQHQPFSYLSSPRLREASFLSQQFGPLEPAVLLSAWPPRWWGTAHSSDFPLMSNTWKGATVIPIIFAPTATGICVPFRNFSSRKWMCGWSDGFSPTFLGDWPVGQLFRHQLTA